jgi:hypothetical protein
MNIIEFFIGIGVGFLICILVLYPFIFKIEYPKEVDTEELTEEEKVEMREWIAHKLEKRNSNLN